MDSIAPAASQMGMYSCLAFVIGNIVGSGIFITPQLVLKRAGSFGLSLIIWLICGIFTVIGSTVFLELGTAIPSDGGDFAYTNYAGWTSVAFGLMSITVFIGYPGSAAVQCNTFGSYIVSGIEPFTNIRTWSTTIQTILGAGLLVMCTVVNIFPAGKGASRFQVCATLAKTLVLVVIVSVGLFHFIILNERDDDPFAGSKLEPGAVTIASYHALWAYAGWDVLIAGTPSVKNPRRTLPVAMIGGLLFVITLYLLLNVSFVTILGVAGMKESTAIASDFARKSMGPLHWAVPFAIALMFISTVNGSIFALSRIMSKAAEEGQLPKFLAVHHVKYKSPVAALLTQLILSLLMLFLPIDTIIEYVSVIMWLQKATSVAGLLKIRYKNMEVDQGVIRVPILLSLIFLSFCVGMTVVPLFLDEQKLMVIVGFGAVTVITTLSFGLNWLQTPEWLISVDKQVSKFACWLLNGEIKESGIENESQIEETAPLVVPEEEALP